MCGNVGKERKNGGLPRIKIKLKGITGTDSL